MEDSALPKITVARAYANNEVAYIAWDIDTKIPECLGFEVTRIRVNPDGSEDRVRCASWVAFQGQRNRHWLPQDTGVWPVQKLAWRDLTVRKRRDRLERRDDEVRVAYAIRPVGKWVPGLPRATDPTPHIVRVVKRDDQDRPVVENGKRVMIDVTAYEGTPLQLGYLGPATRTNDVLISRHRGVFQSTFTNGILAAQWLSNVLLEDGKIESDELVNMVTTVGDRHREYLAGDVLRLFRDLFKREGEFFLALYELDDPELIELLVTNRDRVHVILANSAFSKEDGVWDARNRKARQALIGAPVAELQHRMFNNDHIGHNKFVVHVPADGAARSVLTGSTNWTSFAVAAQTNNALLVEDDTIAGTYLAYWRRLHDDALPVPASFGDAQPKNVQSLGFRKSNAHSVTRSLPGGVKVDTWFAPNTTGTTKGTQVPPDLSDVYLRMQHAQQAILFLAFYPGQSGKDSIVAKAIEFGRLNGRLIVVGAVSSAEAMPNYVPGNRKAGVAAKSPFMFEEANVSIVRAARIDDRSLADDFGVERLVASEKGVGAIIHDKVMVIDPMLDTCCVVLGSHNLGSKASYVNDENLMMVSGDKPLAEAYAVHILDVYDHYRFRAIVAERKARGQPRSSGFLDTTDAWMDKYAAREKGAVMRYFARRMLD
jgi:phosphatidylserine/phosphatidylglycerophosphate/cardiolipin synthase-like enzyme